MKSVLKTGGILLVAACVIGAVLFFVAGPRPRATANDVTAAATAVVSRGSIEQTISATGNAAAEQQVTLAFGSSGRIDEVLVEEGQQVKAGDVLARLDTRSLEWQVARAQASLDTTQARLKQTQRPAGAEELASAQAAVDSAIASYEKVKAGPTKEELASARAAVDSAAASYEKVKAGPTKEELASAKAALDSARASLEQAQAAYDQVKDRPDIAMLPQALNLQTATNEYERAKANYESTANHPTPSELAAAKAQVSQAEASLAQLQARPTASELAAAKAQVSQAEASLAQLRARPTAEEIAVAQAQVDEAAIALDQAKSQLDDAVLTAPFDGAILSVQARGGEWATPGTPAISLVAGGSLLLKVNVDEVDVPQVSAGQTAHLRFNALKGDQIAGTVTHVALAPSNIGGAVAYGVEIRFDPGQLPVRLGMTAEVEIVVASADDTLLVPNRAVTADREAGRYYVTRQRADSSTERLEVQIGLRDGQYTQILAGLNEGDRLALPEVPTQSTSSQYSGPFGGMMRQGGQ
ncbi:MAG: efflux RND transporter periplasmic adaptor subunit [Anaerolineae bacterium]|nr:efflux RND transporter periplasmic adaptor subunit [Anaerolineae bacterium]